MRRLRRPNPTACRGAAAVSEYMWLHKEYFLLEAKTTAQRREIECFLAWVKQAGAARAPEGRSKINPFSSQGLTLVAHASCPQIRYPRGE